jgi:bifunctional non-homologous end joining protein LigD
MRLRLVREALDDDDFIFELKHDGFRGVVYVEEQQCRLASRNQRSLKFASLKTSLAKLPVDNVILDGEIICVDRNGVSRFNQLLNRKMEPVLYAFDLLWFNGEDLRQLPLIERKARLGKFVRSVKCDRLLFAQHIETTGKRFFQEICARDLEGIVAKRKMGIYKSGSNSWLKVKNPSYTQAEGRHELPTGSKRAACSCLPPSIFLPADFEPFLELARSRQYDIAAQTAEPFPRFNQFFI